jgi:hypothetical protein
VQLLKGLTNAGWVTLSMDLKTGQKPTDFHEYRRNWFGLVSLVFGKQVNQFDFL